VGSGLVFKSFDRARWDAIFGNRAAGAEQKIVDAMLGWEEGYFDGSDELRPGYDRDRILSSAEGKAARELAAHLVNKGFKYDSLSESQSVQLDTFGCLMWAPEGLGNALDAKQLSLSWLTSRTVAELLFRAGQLQSIKYMEVSLGRRPRCKKGDFGGRDCLWDGAIARTAAPRVPAPNAGAPLAAVGLERDQPPLPNAGAPLAAAIGLGLTTSAGDRSPLWHGSRTHTGKQLLLRHLLTTGVGGVEAGG
jgi:hypothetical protein